MELAVLFFLVLFGVIFWAWWQARNYSSKSSYKDVDVSHVNDFHDPSI